MKNTGYIGVWTVVLALALAFPALGAGPRGKNGSHGGGARHQSLDRAHQRSAGGHFNRPAPSRRNDIYDYTHRRSGASDSRSRQSPSNRRPSGNDHRNPRSVDRTVDHSRQRPQNRRQERGNRETRRSSYRSYDRGHDNRAVRYGPHGGRTIHVHNGVIHERPFRRHRHSFVRRTYIRNNVVSVRNYSVWRWGGRPYYGYVPRYIYPRPFFVWIERPWGPVYYDWWWYGDPWFHAYSYYWYPYPVYYGPSFWLTDYVLADILAAAYESDRINQAAAAIDARNAAIDEKIKKEVRKEVEAELKAREKQESVPLKKAVSKGYVHVITKDMNVAVASSDESCLLASGDVVKVAKTAREDDSVVEMKVVTSKRGGCAPNKRVLMSLEDVQDMRNHFSETIDRGLEKLRAEQGKDGIPAAPAEALAKPKDSVTPEETAQAVRDAEKAAKEMESEAPETY